MTVWKNWSGWVRSNPKRNASPSSEAELAAVMQSAPAPLRVVGSGHSFTALGETNGTVISLDNWQGVVKTDAAAEIATLRAGSKIHSIGRPLFDAGLGLKNQGDIDRQAIAGAVGTGTHGTGIALGSLSSEVKGFRLATADGQILDCTPQSNPDVFQAGRVSFGSLGVMSEITLGVRKAYKLKEKNWLMPAEEAWRDLAKWRAAPRHFEFFWFPYADDVVAKTLEETNEDAPTVLTSQQMYDRGERLTADQRTFKYGCELARFVPGIAPTVQRMFTRAAAGVSPTRTRWSHEIFPSPRNVKFNEMEYAVPADKGADCIREVAEAIRKKRINTCYPLEFRFIKGDDIWLSPFYQRDSVTISVHQYAKQSYKALFDLSEAIFKRYEGRPHWGKLHTLGAAEFAKLYPRFEEYRALRRRLDPKGRLLNSHLRTIFGEGNGQKA